MNQMNRTEQKLAELNQPKPWSGVNAYRSDPLVVDMAMSATAMGKIRLAQSRGEDIPAGWATDAQGRPTTSPAEAIAGMLLPAAGPKGFGLAVAVDLLCGALSSGSCGSAVQGLYGDPAVPYDCAHAFIAIDASRVGSGALGGVQPLLSRSIQIGFVIA